MTTATTTRRATFARPVRVTFPHLIRSEWIGLWSIRGTSISLAIGAVLAIGLVVAMAWGYAASDVPESYLQGVITLATGGALVLQIIAVLIGTNIFSREHSSGALRTQFAAAPRRGLIVGAKAVVVGVVTGVYSIVVIGISALSALPFYLAQDWSFTTPGQTWGAEVLAAFGTALYVALTAVLSLGVAAMLRSAAGTIILVLAYLLIIPSLLGSLLPFDWAQDILATFFSNVGTSLYTPQEITGDVVRDMVLTFAWPTVLLIAGILVVRRRDA